MKQIFLHSLFLHWKFPEILYRKVTRVYSRSKIAHLFRNLFGSIENWKIMLKRRETNLSLLSFSSFRNVRNSIFYSTKPSLHCTNQIFERFLRKNNNSPKFRELKMKVKNFRIGHFIPKQLQLPVHLHLWTLRVVENVRQFSFDDEYDWHRSKRVKAFLGSFDSTANTAA